MTEQEFEDKIQQVRQGFYLWQNLVKKNKLVNQDYVFIFPHYSHVINGIGMKYLDLFIQKKRPHKIVILCKNKELCEQIEAKSSSCTLSAELLKEEEIGELLACYSALNISAHVIIMSLTEPAGRYGEKVIERKGIDIDRVVLLGIYGLSLEEVKDEI